MNMNRLYSCAINLLTGWFSDSARCNLNACIAWFPSNTIQLVKQSNVITHVTCAMAKRDISLENHPFGLFTSNNKDKIIAKLI